MMQFSHWQQMGERIALHAPAFGLGRAASIFTVRMGDPAAPHVTLLHGFPTSSLDYAAVAKALSGHADVLSFDFLGFGASEKPRDAAYSIHAQADLTQALWAELGVRETHLVAHDYSASVAQELLARGAEGGPQKTRLRAVALLNGGLYPDLHRPLLIQRLLRTPGLGALVTRFVNEATFKKNLRRIMFAGGTEDAELHEHWAAVAAEDGHLLTHKLIHYIDDRRRHAERWRRGLEQTPVAKTFIWGMRDPISGAHVAARLRERMRPLSLVEMHDVGHYPQLEAPERVSAALLSWLAGSRF